LALGEYAVMSFLVAVGTKIYQILKVVILVIHINMVYMMFALKAAKLILTSVVRPFKYRIPFVW
jgi:hypothetical protein